MMVATPSRLLGEPAMFLDQLPALLATCLTTLATALQARRRRRRCGRRFPGVRLATGRRRTVTAWRRAARLTRQFRRRYAPLHTLGRRTDALAGVLRPLLLRTLAPPTGPLLVARDDTPTPRSGPKVQGAGRHRNPTPGLARQTGRYGHVWTTPGWVLRHPRWGTIALSALARLHVRAQDVARLPAQAGWTFQTQLTQAAELPRWRAAVLAPLQRSWGLVCDGAYATRQVLAAARQAGATVVSRLRGHAHLCDLPAARRPGQRGRPPKYGSQRVRLAKRAGQKRGGQTGTFALDGKTLTKRSTTFLATGRPAGGVIRVVLVNEPTGWRAYFCTDPGANVAAILEAVADRAAMEQAFAEVKDRWGAGDQQVRRVWSNVGAFHLNLWAVTLVEWWAWRQPAGTLRDRRGSPWDRAARRPSHADRRKALRRAGLDHAFQATGGQASEVRQLRRLARLLLKMAG
jgi:hypothetical protein